MFFHKLLVFLTLVLFGCLVFVQAANFNCANGSTIEIKQFCNLSPDCDGSDKIKANASCPMCSYPYVGCTVFPLNQTCLLHRDYLCNATVTCQGLTPCDVGCPTHYKCQESEKCVLRSTVCDGNACNGCPEDDDWQNGVGFKCVRNGRICRLPQQLLWDNVQDCDDGADLCYSFKSSLSDGRDIRQFFGVSFNQQRCSQCLDHLMLVPQHQICDGIIDCADLSDECLCEKQVSDICNHVKLRTERLPTLCLPGQVYCGNGNLTKCVNRTSVCDGISDCINNLDENFGNCHGTLSCSKGLLTDAGMPCRCDTSRCPSFVSVRGVRSGVLCNGVEDCGLNEPWAKSRAKWAIPPGFPPDECDAKCPDVPGKFNCTVPLASAVSVAPFRLICTKNETSPNGTKVTQIDIGNDQICDGVLECTGDYIDEKDCPDRFSCRSGNLVNIPNSQVCDGYENCDNRMDESKTLCQASERFYCKSLKGQKVSVSTKVVCDFNINCDKAEDEMNCSSVDGRFYCENGKPLFVRQNQVLDGRGDCTDWSDECSEKFKTGANVLSSRYELIANPFLRAIVWIMALLAFFGNLIVIVGEIKSLQKVFSKSQGASLRTNHMLVLNLAVADFLMAIYLLMLGIAGAVYSGSYCSQSLSWLTSQSCVAMGVLVVLSSETSVLTMLLLTGTRLFAVYNPIASLNKPSFRAVLLMIMLTWAISLILALVPLSASQQSSFVERVLIESNPFFSNVVVHFDAAKNFTMKLLTYSKHLSSQPDSVLLQVQAMTSWNELEQFLAHFSQSNLLTISNYFGYYSANSVCIPNLFVTSKDWSWQFSLAVSILNFLAFVFVASTYTAIILKARKSINKSQSVGKKSSALQRKIIRLIITDFCCWIPLSIMVFINFSGVKIDSISYAVAAIVLLPINSALNPILYSNFIDKIYPKCRGQVPVGSQPTSRIGSTSLSSQNTTKLRLTTRRAESQVVDKASSSAAE